MSVAGDANAVHEMVHAYHGGVQGRFKFYKDGALFPGQGLTPRLINTNSEIDAYKAQFAFDPGSMPASTFGGTPSVLKQVNAFYVGGINRPNTTTPLYGITRELMNTVLRFVR